MNKFEPFSTKRPYREEETSTKNEKHRVCSHCCPWIVEILPLGVKLLRFKDTEIAKTWQKVK
jgi:hypothetical protein